MRDFSLLLLKMQYTKYSLDYHIAICGPGRQVII